MGRLSMALALILTAALAGEAWAKRAGPKPVAPVVHNGVKYAASNASGREGKIEARNEKTGEKLWTVVVYTVKIAPNLEEDVQWVFITGLAVRDNALVVTNERQEQYVVDLKTKKVERARKGGKTKP